MNNERALTQLGSYAEGRIEADDRIDVEALLEQYLEGMLEPELTRKVEQAIEADARLAEIVERARRGGAWIDEVMVPSMRPPLDEPVSPRMEQFFDDLVAGKIPAEAEDDPEAPPPSETVVPFRTETPPPPTFTAPVRQPWLIAAAVAGLVILAGASVWNLQSYLGAATERQAALEQEVEQLQTERQAQQAQLAELDGQLESLRGDLAATEQQLAAAETSASEALDQIARQAIDRRDLEVELAELRTRQGWLHQVAQYHAFYAELPQRRWVAVDAENRDSLRQYLADLGRDLGLNEPVPLPELNDDLTFLGGRTLVINGMPVAQLGYRDADGRLLAICFMRNPTGEPKPRTVEEIGNLTMVDWKNADFQYVVVGYEQADKLEYLADRLQRSYQL